MKCEVLYVDGENLSKFDIAALKTKFPADVKKYIYQSSAAARKSGYPGFEHVVVPHIGKESCDKCIAMDVVSAYHGGVKSIALAANDHDYGATALHLKSKFPDMDITLICDPDRVAQRYVNMLREARIRVLPLNDDLALDTFTCQVIEVIHELHAQNKLTMPILGATLRERGIEYKNLKKDLVRARVLSPESEPESVVISEAARHRMRTL